MIKRFGAKKIEHALGSAGVAASPKQKCAGASLAANRAICFPPPSGRRIMWRSKR
jgi:hypothetical protein